MKSEQLDAPCTATGTDMETTPEDRTSTLNNFLVANYRNLQDAAYAAYPDLLVFDAEKIIVQLSKKLNRYTGPPLEPLFMKWACRFMIHEAERYKFASQILVEQADVIHAAIHNSLWTSAVDLAVEHQDIYWQVVELIFDRAHSLNRRGTAKLSTRVTGLVKKHIYFYFNSRNAGRKKKVAKGLALDMPIQCERLSDEEIASIRLKDLYDPGYSEVGLSIS
jgi:hypothetical protein